MLGQETERSPKDQTSESSERLRDYAEILYYSNRPSEAIAYLSYLYESNPVQSIYWGQELVTLLQRLDRREEAIELMDQMLLRNREGMLRSPSILYDYLTLLGDADRDEEVSSLLSEIPSEVKSNAQVRFFDILYKSKRNSADDVSLLRDLQRIDPAQIEQAQLLNGYYLLMLQLADQAHDPDAMLRAARQMAQLHPEDIRYRYQVLMVLMRTKQTDVALSEIDQMQQEFPFPAETFTLLRAEVLGQQDDHQRRADFLYQYLSDKDSLTEQDGQIVASLLPVDTEDVLDLPEEYLPTLVRLSEINDLDDVLLSEVYRVVVKYRGKAEGEKLLARFYAKEQTAVTAAKAELQNIKQEDDYQSLTTERQSDRRLRIVEKARARYPKNFDLLRLHSAELFVADRLEEAINLLVNDERVKDLSSLKNSMKPDDLKQTILLMTSVCVEEGDLEEALQWFAEGYEIFPRDPILLNNYAYFLYKNYRSDSARLKQAEELAAAAYGFAPKEPNILDTYGTILIAQGNYTLARLMLSQAVEQAKDLGLPRSDYSERLGDVFYLTGDTTQAIEQWRAALGLSTSETQKTRLQGKIDGRIKPTPLED